MASEKITMRFTIHTEEGKPIIRSWPSNVNLMGFVLELQGDKITDITDQVLSYVYEDHNDFSEGYAVIRRGDNWGYVDLSLAEVVEPKYQECSMVNEGFAKVKFDNKYGFINMKRLNYPCTDFKFDSANSFHNGMAAIRIGDKYGYVSAFSPNAVAIPCQFEKAYDFNLSYPFAVVKINGKYGVIDKQGNFVVKPEFDEYSPYSTRIGNSHYNAKIGDKLFFIGIDASVSEIEG